MEKYKFEYTWSGHFKYDQPKGNWIYHLKEDLSVNSTKNKKLVEKAKQLKKLWPKLIGKLNKYGISLPTDIKTRPFLLWLTGDEKDPPTVKGAIAICLKHFAEVIRSNDGLKKKQNKYEIISSIVDKNTTVQIKGLGHGKPCWFFLHSEKEDIVSESLAEYFLALPRLFFQPNNDKLNLIKDKNKLKEAAQFLKSNRIGQTVMIEFQEKGDDILIHFNSKAYITNYNKGFVCGCIPIPGKEKNIPKKKNIPVEPYIVKTPEIITTSPNVVGVLKYLSQVWQDKFAQSVLISAPPGSGKELFSQSIPYGTGRVLPKEDMIRLSLASGDTQELEKRLYGEKYGVNNISKGFIAKAQDSCSVLFLDEVHHPEEGAGIRASLLRPLESGEYYPCGDISPDDKPQKADKVLFVLATSKPLRKTNNTNGLANIDPPDFWTRMTHVVVVKHPFEGIWKELPDIIERYFKFFWWERLEKYFNIDPETEEPLGEDLGQKDSLDFIQRCKQMNMLKDDSNLTKLAEYFREQLLFIMSEERIQPHELSIRGFRNIVTRLFSISAAEVVQGKGFIPEEIKKEMNAVIYEILEIAKLHS